MELLYSWLTANDAMSMSSSVVLVVTSFFTSMMTATLGIGGGVLLLAVMAGTMPVSALIPVHGLVQLGSNGNRALMMARHIDWSMLKYFSLGAIVGAFLLWFSCRWLLYNLRLPHLFYFWCGGVNPKHKK